MSTNIVQHNVLPITVAIVGIPGPAGTSSAKYKTQIDLVGTKNGVNKTFTIPVTIALVANSETIVHTLGPLKRNEGYTISGNTVTMTVAPLAADALWATYFEV